MKKTLIATVSALALATVGTPAAAQHMHMPGMEMPAKPKPKTKPPAARNKAAAKPKPAATKKQVASKPVRAAPKTAAAKTGPALDPVSEAPMDHSAPAPQQASMDHGQMDHSQMDHGQMTMQGPGHAEHGMTMTGALGIYPMERESSGTAWQPDTSEHSGLHVMSGAWSLMTHATLNLVADHQSGRRGDGKVFASGMLMGTARRAFGSGTLQFKAMVSPDPLMGKAGYPLLLATGETANGRDRLIDRQHPHDFFMELSGSISQSITPKSSAFLYAGLPGEPAFGPPAFMHREAILDSPEAPITHHWLDSTHITFGVVTAGLVVDRAKLEVSRFNAREPDQHRWNIETGPLDSTSVRASWNPTRTLALQGSWGHFVEPEQLEPGEDQRRWSASALWADEVVPGWKLAGTLAWGRKNAHGHTDDAVAAEASLKHGSWTAFGRGEITENRELIDIEHAPAFRVGKLSAGVVRDFRIAEHMTLGAGGLLSVNFVPDRLAPLYVWNNPTGAMGFLRLKLD